MIRVLNDVPHARLGGKRLTPSSFRTHIIVTCNTHPEKRCHIHRDGKQYDHRILRQTYGSMAEVLGK